MLGFSIARGALVVGSTVGPLEIARLSPEDARVRLRGSALQSGQLLQLELFGDGRTVTARVEEVAHDEAETRFLEVSVELARDVARLCDSLHARRLAFGRPEAVVEREEVRDPERIRAILHALFANRCAGRVRADGVARPRRLMVARIEPESVVPLQWELEEPWPEPPLTIAIDGYMSIVEFRATAIQRVDGFLAMPVPTELVRRRSRTQRRVLAPSDVILSFAHPRWPELRIRRQLRDVSLDGMQIACHPIKDLLYPGLELPDAHVVWRDRIVCRCTAEVRHLSDDVDSEAQLAGIRVTFDDPDERQHWLEETGRLLYPDTRSDATWSEQLWELYRDARYLELSHKSEAEFLELKEAFASASVKMTRSRLGCQAVWPSSRGLEASISILRAYQHGSLIYQLARRPGRVPLRFPGRLILRDIYLHVIEDMQRNEEARWLNVWIQHDARFSRLVHVDFPRRYAASGRVLLWGFRALEVDVSTPPQPVPEGLTLGPATAQERDRLLGHIAETRTHHYIEAHDLSPETFEQRALKRAWADAGLHRGRELVIARADGRPVAAALVESASEGLHLYRLLDVVRLYVLEAGGARAYPALLDEARRVYAGLKKPLYIVFAEPADLPFLAPLRLRDPGGADAVLLPSNLLPELLEHVYEVTAPRDVPKLRGP